MRSHRVDATRPRSNRFFQRQSCVWNPCHEKPWPQERQAFNAGPCPAESLKQGRRRQKQTFRPCATNRSLPSVSMPKPKALHRKVQSSSHRVKRSETEFASFSEGHPQDDPAARVGARAPKGHVSDHATPGIIVYSNHHDAESAPPPIRPNNPRDAFRRFLISSVDRG